MTTDRGGDQADLQEKVVHIRRVAKVVKGGRNLTFNAMVVVGDGKGRVGAGLGKGTAVPDAVRKGATIARKNMIIVPLRGDTLPHSVNAHFGASSVLIKPAQAGAGVKAGGAVRAVMEAAGVKDVVTKALGSRNPINVVKATLSGLRYLQMEGEEESATAANLPQLPPERRGPMRKENTSRRDRDRGRPGGGASRPREAPPAAEQGDQQPDTAAAAAPRASAAPEAPPQTAPTEAPAPAPQAPEPEPVAQPEGTTEDVAPAGTPAAEQETAHEVAQPADEEADSAAVPDSQAEEEMQAASEEDEHA